MAATAPVARCAVGRGAQLAAALLLLLSCLPPAAAVTKAVCNVGCAKPCVLITGTKDYQCSAGCKAAFRYSSGKVLCDECARGYATQVDAGWLPPTGFKPCLKAPCKACPKCPLGYSSAGGTLGLTKGTDATCYYLELRQAVIVDVIAAPDYTLAGSPLGCTAATQAAIAAAFNTSLPATPLVELYSITPKGCSVLTGGPLAAPNAHGKRVAYHMQLSINVAAAVKADMLAKLGQPVGANYTGGICAAVPYASVDGSGNPINICQSVKPGGVSILGTDAVAQNDIIPSVSIAFKITLVNIGAGAVCPSTLIPMLMGAISDSLLARPEVADLSVFLFEGCSSPGSAQSSVKIAANILGASRNGTAQADFESFIAGTILADLNTGLGIGGQTFGQVVTARSSNTLAVAFVTEVNPR